jgi:hypothetical protein
LGAFLNYGIEEGAVVWVGLSAGVLAVEKMAQALQIPEYTAAAR